MGTIRIEVEIERPAVAPLCDALAVAEVRDAIARYESVSRRMVATQRRCAAYARALPRDTHPDIARAIVGEKVHATSWERAVEHAYRTACSQLTLAVLIAAGQVGPLTDVDADGFRWRPCGVAAGDKLAWIEPDVTYEGEVDFRIESARLAVVDLRAVVALDGRKCP